MRCCRIALIPLVCLGALVTGAAGQSQCESVLPVAGSSGYQWRPNADRCEGFYKQQVAGSLEFMSLAIGAINYDLVSDKWLVVSVPGAARFNATKIYLTARALRPGIYYRMDAVVKPGETFRWPLGAVLAPANLSADTIGVVGWIDRDLGKYYVPVSVVPENVVASALRPPTLILRSSLDVEVLRWRHWREGGGAKVDWNIVGGSVAPTRIRAGQTFKLDLTNQLSGPTVVEIAPKYANVDRVQTLPIRVIIP
jgi:hypothetical protein